MSRNAEVGGIDLAAVSPEDLVGLVGSASRQELAEAMNGPLREPSLQEIFSRIADHLDGEKAKGKDAVIHFKILDRPDGGYDHFEVIIRDGRCTVSDSPTEQPRVTIRIGPVDFLKLITSHASGQALFMTGKLKLEGDVIFASQLTSLFRIPSASTEKGSN